MNKRAQVVYLPPEIIQKLDLSRPAAEQISASLKTAILDMSLKPGQIISETEVGHLFGASRTPVREAFTWLREQGLIETYPSRGNYVSKLSIPEIRGAQFVRESLEISVVERLCETGLSKTVIDEIEENLESQQEYINAGQGVAFHQLDDAFHLALANAVGHPRISTVIQKEKAYLDRLRVLSLNSPDNIAHLLEDHRNTFITIRSGDKIKARNSVQVHLRRVLNTLSDMVHKHRDYFIDK